MRMYNLNWSLKPTFNGPFKSLGQSNSAAILHSIGSLLDDHIPAQHTYNIQIRLHTSTHIKFNLSLSPNYNVGIYMSKNTMPTLTKFTYFETFNGNKEFINVNTAFVHRLTEGTWFIVIFNDNINQLEFKFRSEFYEKNNIKCAPHNCNGRGDCTVNGECICYTGKKLYYLTIMFVFFVTLNRFFNNF